MSPRSNHDIGVLVADLGDAPGSKGVTPSSKWFDTFRKRWGFSFQEKTNVKKKSVRERLPYIMNYHQYYVWYEAFKEEPS